MSGWPATRRRPSSTPPPGPASSPIRTGIFPPISPPSTKIGSSPSSRSWRSESWLTGTRGVSLPFTDECPPILPDGNAVRRCDSVEVISRAGSRRWRTIEFRGRGTRHGGSPRVGGIPDPRTGPRGNGRGALLPIPLERPEKHPEGGEAGIAVASDPTPAGVREFYRLNWIRKT